MRPALYVWYLIKRRANLLPSDIRDRFCLSFCAVQKWHRAASFGLQKPDQCNRDTWPRSQEFWINLQNATFLSAFLLYLYTCCFGTKWRISHSLRLKLCPHESQLARKAPRIFATQIMKRRIRENSSSRAHKKCEGMFSAAKAGKEHVFKSTWLLEGNHAEACGSYIFIFLIWSRKRISQFHYG